MGRHTAAKPKRKDDVWEPTPNSIEEAKKAQQLEREQFEGCTGLHLDEEGRVARALPEPIPVSA